MSREAREELTRRQAALTGLTKNPNWPEYVAEWKRKVARIEKDMVRIAKSPDGANQRQLDYMRGCIDMLNWQITMPNVAEHNLIRFLRSQGIEIEEEEMLDV